MNVGSLFATLSLDSSRFTRGLGEATTGLGMFSQRIGVVTRSAATLGVVLTAALGGAAVQSALTLDRALVPVGTAIGRNTEAMKEMEAGIKDILRSSAVTPADLGMAAYQILSSGITDTTEALNTLKVSVELSQAGLGGLEGTAELVAAAVHAFAPEGLTAAQAAKVFFGTIVKGQTTMAELQQGFGQLAPIAQAAGVSFTEVMAAVSAMTRVGEPAATVYAGLRGALSNILQPTKEASETAQRLGIDFSVAHLQAVGLGQFMAEIGQKAGGDAEAITSLVGSIRGMAIAFGLTGAEAQDFQDNLTALDEEGGKLHGRFLELNASLSRQMTILRNRVNIALEEIGRKILGWWIPKLMEATDWVRVNWPRIQETFHDVAEYIKGILDAMFGPALDRIKPKLEEFVNWIRDHWPQISNIAGQVADFLADEVAPRIGTALGWLIDEGGKFADWFMQNVWPDVKHAAEVAWDWMSTDGVRLAKQAADGAVEAFNWMRRNVPVAWNDVRRATEISWNWMKNNVWPILHPVVDAFVEAWSTIKNWTITHWDEIKAFLSDTWTVIGGIAKVSWELLKLTWKYLGDDILAVTKIIWEEIRGTLQAFWDMLRGAMKVFADLFKGDWAGVWDGIKIIAKGAWELMYTQIKTSVEGVANLVMMTIHALGAPWMEAWNHMGGAARDLFDQLKRDVQGKLDTLRDIIMTSLHWIRDQIWDPVVNQLKTGFSDAMQTMNDLVGPILDGIRGGFDFVRDGVQWLIDKIQELIDKIKGPLSAVSDIVSSVGGGIQHAAGWANPSNWHLAYGGIATGPMSGYTATLHGTEAVLPLNDPKRTDQILRALGRGGGSQTPVQQVTVVVVSSPEAAMAYLPREAKGQAQDAILKGRRY